MHMVILHSNTTMLCHINFHLLTGKNINNYSYSRQISRWTEREESTIAQSRGILWVDTHMYYLNYNKIVKHVIDDNLQSFLTYTSFVLNQIF